MSGLKGFFASANDVNEDTVMGFFCFVGMCVAGFVPMITLPIFYGFMSSMLLFFGKNLTKDHNDLLKK